MALRLHEFQEQIIMDLFLIKSTQFEKNESINKIFIQLRNPINKSYRNK